MGFTISIKHEKHFEFLKSPLHRKKSIIWKANYTCEWLKTFQYKVQEENSNQFDLVKFYWRRTLNQ